MAKAKNSKRKREKTGTTTQPAEPEKQPADAMSQCVLLCREQRWREALLLCRRMSAKAQEEGNPDLYVSLGGAQAKIEYSLRRQMAASYLKSTRQVLVKEYLLDV